MGARGAHTFPSRNRLPYPFSLVVRPLFCFVVCWHSLPFQDKYVSGDSVNFRGSDIEQGWSKYLDRLVGPIYPDLVKDFWVHATVTSTAIISFVLGHEVVISEKLIRKLYNLNDEEGWSGFRHASVDWSIVEKQISQSSGIDSNNTGTLRPFYRVWAEIILGSLHLRKRMLSSSYISPDHKYTLFCIGKKIEINISHILFENLKTSIFKSREDERAKYPHIPRTTIPFGRMISDILIE